MLSAGIVGLPNVGKSTLFKAITNSQVLIENYPFATINPNVGTCFVQDTRIFEIAEIIKPEKILPTVLKLYDIAGLVQGASKGQGLGNQFLSHIKNVDAICEVIRCFEDNEIIHTRNKIDPVGDLELIELELIFADLETTNKRIEKISKKFKSTNDKNIILEISTLKTIKKSLEQGISARDIQLNKEEVEIIKTLNLLTFKPLLIVANISEKDIISKTNIHVETLKKYAEQKNLQVITICAKAESDISEIDNDEKQEYLKLLNMETSGVDKLVIAAYNLLNLGTFFTAGKQEVRAWTFIKGMFANECAGIIHSDFKKGFIKVEIYSTSDLLKYQTEKKLREAGKIRIEGKNYQIQDGDICFFRFNV